MTENVWLEVLRAVESVLREGDTVAWVTGGCLRETLLGRAVYDVDLVIAPAGGPRVGIDGLDVALRAFAGTRGYGIARLQHDTLRIAVAGKSNLHLDISPLRGQTLAADLARRDFTINTMALPLQAAIARLARPLGEPAIASPPAGLIDPLNGLHDLRQRRLRLASPTAFLDDAGRILRAARFLAALDLTPTAATTEAAIYAAPSLAELNVARTSELLSLLFAVPQVAVGVEWLRAIGALTFLGPSLAVEVSAEREEAALLVRALALAAALHPGMPTTSGPLAPLAEVAALHDRYALVLPAGYPRFVALAWGLFAHALRLRPRLGPGGQIGMIAAAIVRHSRQAESLLAATAPSLPAIRRYFALWTGREELGLDVLVAATARAGAEAELGLREPAEAERMIGHAAQIATVYFADSQRYVPAPLLSGTILRTMLPQLAGQEIGDLLRQVREAQLEDRIATRDEAQALACNLANLT